MLRPRLAAAGSCGTRLHPPPTTSSAGDPFVQCSPSSWQDGRRPSKGLDDHNAQAHDDGTASKAETGSEPYLGAARSTSQVTRVKEGLAAEAHRSQRRTNEGISSCKGCSTSCPTCLTLAPKPWQCSNPCRPCADGAFFEDPWTHGSRWKSACAPAGLGIEASRPKSHGRLLAFEVCPYRANKCAEALRPLLREPCVT